MKRTQHSGFTLIELAIVLVIIGLVIGGVIVGRDLIETGKARSIASSIESYTTAINMFRTKFNCLPGDCANGSSYFSDSGSGNGDGVIDNQSNNGAYQVRPREATAKGHLEEVTLASEHLAKASLISLPLFNSRTDTIPTTGMDTTWFTNLGEVGVGIIAVASPTQRNALRLAARQNPGTPRITFDGIPSLSQARAYYIDTKLDDGLPRSGKIVHERSLDYQLGGGDAFGCHISQWGNAYDLGGLYTSPSTPLSLPCMLTVYGRY